MSTAHQIDMLPSAADFLFQPILLHPLHITYGLVYRETAPFSSTSNVVIAKDPARPRATWVYSKAVIDSAFKLTDTGYIKIDVSSIVAA